MENTFAKRLSNARKIRLLSQRALCKQAGSGISPSTIAKYEKGEMMPSSSVLIMLADALGMSIDYFFQPFSVDIDPEKFEFRKSASLGMKKVNSVKNLISYKIEKYLEIENILGENTEFGVCYGNISVESEEDAKNVADRLRRDLCLGSDAIVSAIELMETIGVKVIEIDAEDGFSGTCNKAGGIPVIVINKSLPSERKRITVFHELGHLIMQFSEGVDQERMCTVFANEMLIPSEAFKRLIGASRKDISLVELKAIQQEYGISVDALMAKARELNIISETRYVSYHKKRNALPKFKESVLKSVYPMEQTSRFERLVYKALASELITVSKAAALLETPVSKVRENLNLM